jgi:hypothetical protein
LGRDVDHARVTWGWGTVAVCQFARVEEVERAGGLECLLEVVKKRLKKGAECRPGASHGLRRHAREPELGIKADPDKYGQDTIP